MTFSLRILNMLTKLFSSSLALVAVAFCTTPARAITVADAKSNHVDTGQSITLTDVRITNLYDMIEVPFVLINVEDDTGGIAIFMDSTTPAADYSSYLPGDVFDIETQVSVFFGLEEVLDGSLGAPPAIFTPKGTNTKPTVTPVPITTFPGLFQEDAGTTPDDPLLESLESTQVLFESVTIDQLRVHQRDALNQLIDPPTITVPDGSTVAFPTVTADDDFATVRINDGVTPEADRPTVRIRSSSAPVIGQIIPNGPVNLRALVYDVKRTDQIGEGRYRPYILDVESTILGDTDYDYDVDSFDYATASASFTQPAGISGSTAPSGIQFAGDPIAAISWDDGNIDRDFDVDNTDLLTIIGAITSPAPSGPAGSYTLLYDPATGEVLIDTDGGVLTGYSLSGTSFSAASHSSLLSGTVTSDAAELSEAELSSTLVGSQLSIGMILPSGLSEIDFANLFENAVYTAEAGTGVNNFMFALVQSTVPGDFDGDGFVGLSDLNILGANWNTMGGTPNGPGDADGDGNVGLSDLNLLGANWSPSPTNTVPEPTTVYLALVGSMIAIAGRRHGS